MQTVIFIIESISANPSYLGDQPGGFYIHTVKIKIGEDTYISNFCLSFFVTTIDGESTQMVRVLSTAGLFDITTTRENLLCSYSVDDTPLGASDEDLSIINALKNNSLATINVGIRD